MQDMPPTPQAGPEMTPEEFRKRYVGCVSQRRAYEIQGDRGTLIRKAFANYSDVLEDLEKKEISFEESNTESVELFKKLGEAVMRIWFFGKKKELYEEIVELLRNERSRNLGDKGPSFVDNIEVDGVYFDLNDPDLVKLKDLFDLTSIPDENGILRYSNLYSTKFININLTALVDGMLSYNGDSLRVEE